MFAPKATLILALFLAILAGSADLMSVSLTKVKGGSIVALITPMTASNEIDLPKLMKLLQWHAIEGTDGVVILGTTGGDKLDFNAVP